MKPQWIANRFEENGKFATLIAKRILSTAEMKQAVQDYIAKEHERLEKRLRRWQRDLVLSVSSIHLGFSMKSNEQPTADEYKKYESIGSGTALLATGVAAVAGAPVVTGVFVGAAAISSSVAAYNYYRALEREKKSESKIDT